MALEEFSGNKRVAIVDTSDALEEQARDLAEERLSASKEDLKGISGVFSRIWKHNLAREYYRQVEIAKAKAEISEAGDLYVGEGADHSVHEAAMSSVVDRFVQEYEEVIHTDAGEERRVVGNESPENQHLNMLVRALIREYASGRIDEDNFNEEKKRVISEATGLDGEELENTVNHTDNIFDIAKQAKLAVEHGASLDQIDKEIEIVVGKAKLGVRTESNFNTVDRIVSKLQSSRIGQFFNETTIATGVAIGYSLTAGISNKLVRSKALAWGTLGASVVIGGVVAGARESVKIEDERRQHSRERAKGKEASVESERRSEMENLIYKTVSATTISESLNTLTDKISNPEEFLNAVMVLAEAESRISLSDVEKIDLISYQDFGKIEKERLDLDIARAKAKIKLRSLVEDGTITLPDGKAFDDFYNTVVNQQMDKLEEGEGGLDEKDRLFKKMKRKKIAGAVFKSVTSGLVIGGVAQETGALLNDHKEGLMEHFFGVHTERVPKSVTALEGMRRWIVGEKVEARGLHQALLPDGSKVVLPDGVEITPNLNASHEFVFSKDGEVISEHIKFENGSLTPESEDILKQHEVNITRGVAHLTEQAEVNSTPQEVVSKHEDLFHKVHRKFWYDNDTSRIDKNELKLHFGGQNGTGIGSDGKYVFNVAKMTPDGSVHDNLSVDTQNAIKEGKLKLLLSLSKETQFNAVEVPIDEHGNAIIDPNSEIGKIFFVNEGGHLKFIGKFAEVGHAVGKAGDGGDQFEILSTHVGEGSRGVVNVQDVVKDVPVTNFDVVDHEPFVEPPMFIPVVGRTPLEPMESKRLTDRTREYYYSNGNEDYGLLDRKKYRERMSKKILEDKNIDLSKDDLEIIVEYLNNEDPGYIAELNKLIEGTKPIGSDIETVITVPAYQEGKNLEKTIRSYAKLKNRSKFELVILENHSAGVSRDNTLEVIEKMKLEFPDLNIVNLYKVFDKKPTIGEVRKYLVDSVMLRKVKSNIKNSLAIVSNDADLEDISENYADKISETFKKDPNIDALGAKWDFPEKNFKKFPLLHASQRLWQYLDISFRNYYLKSPELIGRNSAFRSGVYAAIGGYNKNAKLAEDLEIGWLIKEARGYDAARISYVNSAWLASNSRRAVVKMLSGGNLIEQYGDFHTNEEVREATLDKLLEDKIDFDEEKFHKQVQSIYDHYSRWRKSEGGWVEDKYVDMSFDRAMRFLGVNYKLEKGKVVIKDMSRLVEGLNR